MQSEGNLLQDFITMPLRAWMYVFAIIGLTLTPTYAISREGIKGGETGAGASAGLQAEPIFYGFVAALDRIEAAILSLIREESEKERRHIAERSARDLSAQEEMAGWAGEMAWATILAAGFTFGGLILIGITLYYTRRAAEYTQEMLEQAKITTKATVEAINIEREARANAVAEMKAYIAIEQSVFSYIRGDPSAVSDLQKGTFRVTLRNTGMTRARNVEVWFKITWNGLVTDWTRSFYDRQIQNNEIKEGESAHFTYVSTEWMLDIAKLQRGEYEGMQCDLEVCVKFKDLYGGFDQIEDSFNSLASKLDDPNKNHFIEYSGSLDGNNTMKRKGLSSTVEVKPT
jgi:hypothetical protein